MFRNLIFDWSGTLVDDLGPVIEATNAVLEKYQIAALDREGFRRAFRLPYREFYADLLPDVPLAELETHFRPAFAAALTPVTVLPHAREKLEWCAALGIRCFVLTSMDTQSFERQLDDFGFRKYFEATYSSVLDKRDIIHKLLTTHQLEPAETAFVGDMTHDVETARHGGIASIAVLTGYNHPEILATVRPDITVPDLGVLRSLLDRRQAQLEVARPIATVGALIADEEGRVLLVRTQKWGNRWGIPGGKIERGESATAALEREILEETGLTLSHVRFALVQDSIDSPEFQRPAHFLLLNYFAQAASTAGVVLNHEAQEFRWLSPAEALALDLNQPTRTLLLHALSSGAHVNQDSAPSKTNKSHMPDTIEIRRLRVTTLIGVPDEERATAQTLLVTLTMTPSQGFEGLADDISRTINYYQVSLEIEALAAAHPRHLIETLATDIADHLLSHHAINHLAVTIEKHILPNTECVAVHLQRSR